MHELSIAAGILQVVRDHVPAAQLPQLSATLTTGPDIRLIDISRGGALFECSKRLVPQSAVALRLVTPDGTHIVRGRVVRSRIVRMERGGLGYQAAIAFNEALRDLIEESRFADDTGEGGGAGAARTGQADAEAPDAAVRSEAAGSNTRFSSRTSRNCASAAIIGPLRDCAAVVGTIPDGVRINSGSSNVRRNRVSALLIAGWLNPRRLAARVTFLSDISASNTSTKFRSMVCRFIL